jgi:hypothetical protein
MRESIQKTVDKLAELDAAGVAVVILRSEAESDIYEAAAAYPHKGMKRVEKINKGSGSTNIEYHPNMFQVTERYARPFDDPINKDSWVSAATNISKDFLDRLVNSVKDNFPQMIYIHDISYFFGGSESHNSKDASDSMYISALCEISAAKLRGENRTLIIAGASEAIPQCALSEYLYIYDVPYPEIPEIKDIILETKKEVTGDAEIREELLNEIAERFLGFRRLPIISTIKGAYAEYENPLRNGAEKLFEKITNAKKQLLMKTGGLEWMDKSDKCDKVAGIDKLIEWVKNLKPFFINSAACSSHDEDMPKGVLVAGVPGSGKSLLAKNMSMLLDIPLIKMDMGSLMGKYLGESEANVAKAIKLAEALSPCVLWIDELEKAFAGIKEGTANEAVMRVFNSVLTWMQDRFKPCFVYATANNISKLPQEFLRKERFDEKFYVFMPTAKECDAIFKSHLLKKKAAFTALAGKTDDESKVILEPIIKNIIDYCAKNDKYLTGADIASVVKSAFRTLFTKAYEILPPNKLKESASTRVIFYTLGEVQQAIIAELDATRTFGEDVRGVCTYWCSLLVTPFRESSDSASGKYSISQNPDNFNEDTYEFTNWGMGSGETYLKNLKEKKKTTSLSYDERFALTLAIGLVDEKKKEAR